MDTLIKTAAIPLDFVVVGASIAGLSSAYALRQAGHNVTLLEKNGPILTSNGGLRVPPNMTRLLQNLPGVMELLETNGTKCSALAFVHAETFQLIGRMKFLREVMSDLGCDFWMIPYDVLRNHLVKLCEGLGIKIVYNITLACLLTGSSPAAISTSGQRFQADVIVGADGRHSVVRGYVSQPPAEDEDEYDAASSESIRSGSPVTELFGCTLSIPLPLMLKDPQLKDLAESDEFIAWPGSGIIVTGHKCGPELYILGMVRSEVPEEDVAIDSDWQPGQPLPVPPDQLVPGYNPKIKKLVELASTCHMTTQGVHNLSKLADAPARIVLVGDAAHTAPIHCTHNASLAVGDGFTLGRLFRHVTSRDQIPALLDGYNQVRYKRISATECAEIESIRVITLPPGPHQESRDRAFLATLALDSSDADIDDDVLAAAWENYLIQFNFDAQEAVDEWWMNWGKFSIGS